MVTVVGDAETIGLSASAVGYQFVEFGITIRMLPGAVIVIGLSPDQQIAQAQLLRCAEGGPRIDRRLAGLLRSRCFPEQNEPSAIDAQTLLRLIAGSGDRGEQCTPAQQLTASASRFR